MRPAQQAGSGAALDRRPLDRLGRLLLLGSRERPLVRHQVPSLAGSLGGHRFLGLDRPTLLHFDRPCSERLSRSGSVSSARAAASAASASSETGSHSSDEACSSGTATSPATSPSSLSRSHGAPIHVSRAPGGSSAGTVSSARGCAGSTAAGSPSRGGGHSGSHETGGSSVSLGERPEQHFPSDASRRSAAVCGLPLRPASGRLLDRRRSSPLSARRLPAPAHAAASSDSLCGSRHLFGRDCLGRLFGLDRRLLPALPRAASSTSSSAAGTSSAVLPAPLSAVTPTPLGLGFGAAPLPPPAPLALTSAATSAATSSGATGSATAISSAPRPPARGRPLAPRRTRAARRARPARCRHRAPPLARPR